MVIALENMRHLMGSSVADAVQGATGELTAGVREANRLVHSDPAEPIHRGTWAELCPLPSGLALPPAGRAHENALDATLSTVSNKPVREEPSLLAAIGKSVSSFVGSLVESAPDLAHSLLPFAALLGGPKLAGGLALFGLLTAGYHLAGDIKLLITAKDSKERKEALKGIGRKIGLMATLFGFAKERGVFSDLLSSRPSATPAETEDKAGSI